MTSFIQDAAQPIEAPLIGTMPASGNVFTLDDAPPLKYRAASRGNGQERIQEGLEGEAPLSPADESSGDAGIYQEVLYSAPAESHSGDAAEASYEQLAECAGTAQESAFDDLRGLDGFDGYEPAAEEELDPGNPPEAWAMGGAVADAELSFGGILGGIKDAAVGGVKTLVSKVAPHVVKKATDLLPSKVRRALKKAAAMALKHSGVAGTLIGGPLGATIGLAAQVVKKATEATSQESTLSAEEEAQAAELADMIESVIGSDDRLRIGSTTAAPWRWICALRIHHPDGSTSRGTGFFIAPRVVATAGHCVYMQRHGGFASSIDVMPAMDAASQPYGAATSKSFATTQGWKTQGLAEADFGCIFLPEDAFETHPGTFSLAAFSAAELVAQPAVLAGYPGDKPWAEMWGMARQIKKVNEKTVMYDIDTYGGQSGSPVYIVRDGKRYVVGIHNYGDSGSGNSATRVTPQVFGVLRKWSKKI